LWRRVRDGEKGMKKWATESTEGKEKRGGEEIERG